MADDRGARLTDSMLQAYHCVWQQALSRRCALHALHIRKLNVPPMKPVLDIYDAKPLRHELLHAVRVACWHRIWSRAP